jgi:putative ABC transport system permease protein
MTAHELKTAFVFARRELRGGIKGFRIFLACLFLGVAAIAAVGSLTASILAGLDRNAQAMLGGDIELRRAQRPASAADLASIAPLVAATSADIEMRAMAIRPDGAARTLVQLKAVDGAYPLYGTVDLAHGGALAAALARRDGMPGCVIEDALAIKLDIHPGDAVKIGDTQCRVNDLIEHEPDRAVEGLNFGPRLMIAQSALPDTGLMQPGSLIEYRLRLALPPGSDVARAETRLTQALGNDGWRVRDATQASPAVERTVERIGLFLTLVGLTALLIGGVGVGNAVGAYLATKSTTIATLKSIGAPARLIFTTYLTLVLVLALGGIVAGIAVGAAAPWAAKQGLAELLPVPIEPALYPMPLLTALAFGLLTALAFSLWPLGRARAVRAASLFRGATSTAGRPGIGTYAGIALAVASLGALAVLTAPNRDLAGWFVAAALLCFAAFRVAGRLLVRLAGASHVGDRPRLRLALGNLRRPGAPTVSVVLSLGLGLTVLVTVALIQANLSREVAQRLPKAAPTFFFVDIQPDQAESFDRLATTMPGVSDVRRVPSLRGRIAAIGRAGEANAAPRPGSSWVLDSDRGLTYAATMPPDTKLVAGEWWPADYAGPPEVSFDARAAQELGLAVGDTLTINVLGRDITARIANLRDIDWAALNINFAIIFAPGTLEAAPHSFLATARATPEAEPALLRAVTDRFSNVSAVRVKDALDAITGLLDAIGGAARLTALLTLVAGTLVLAGAMIAGQQRRIQDAVILKVLGATRRDLIGAYMLEYGLLGLATALVSCLLGSAAAWAVVTHLMHADWHFDPASVVLTVCSCTVVTILFGLAGTWHALGQRAAPLLREA